MAMDRFLNPGPGSLRNARTPVSPFHTRGLGPFAAGEAGAAGHPIGWLIVAVLILGAAIGIPGAPLFVLLMLGLSALVGCVLRLWHQSTSSF